MEFGYIIHKSTARFPASIYDMWMHLSIRPTDHVHEYSGWVDEASPRYPVQPPPYFVFHGQSTLTHSLRTFLAVLLVRICQIIAFGGWDSVASPIICRAMCNAVTPSEQLPRLLLLLCGSLAVSRKGTASRPSASTTRRSLRWARRMSPSALARKTKCMCVRTSTSRSFSCGARPSGNPGSPGTMNPFRISMDCEIFVDTPLASHSMNGEQNAGKCVVHVSGANPIY